FDRRAELAAQPCREFGADRFRQHRGGADARGPGPGRRQFAVDPVRHRAGAAGENLGAVQQPPLAAGVAEIEFQDHDANLRLTSPPWNSWRPLSVSSSRAPLALTPAATPNTRRSPRC